MKRGKVGKALEKVITTKPSEPKTTKPMAQLMSPIRREIFQHLCTHPCSNVSKISRAVNRSIHTVEWHLKKLIEDKYISARKDLRNTVYYPLGLLGPGDLAVLEALNIQRIRDVFIQILSNPGVTQEEISVVLEISHQSVSRITEKLKGLKLITSVDDGRFRRYYPSNLLELKREGNHKRVKGFKKAVVDKLESEGLNPTVIRSTDIELMVRLIRGKEKAFLKLSCDPFSTVLL